MGWRILNYLKPIMKVIYNGKDLWFRMGKSILVIQTYDDDFVIAGFQTSLDSDVTENNGGTDIWVIKINDGMILSGKILLVEVVTTMPDQLEIPHNNYYKRIYWWIILSDVQVNPLC